MKKPHVKEMIAVVGVILAVSAIVFASNPRLLQGNLQLGSVSNVQTNPAKEKDYGWVPNVQLVAGSNSIQEGINSVLATAIENKGSTLLKALTVHLTSKNVNLTTFRLMLNGKDVTTFLDKNSQTTLAGGYTSLGTSTKDFTLTSSTGLTLNVGTNKLELQTTSRGTTRDSTLTTSVSTMIFTQNGTDAVVSGIH